MVAASRQRRRAGLVQRGEKSLDPLQRILEVDRVDRRVAVIADPAQLIGRDEAHMMHPPHQRRHVADFARAVARAGAVGGAAVPRHPDQRDVELCRIALDRQAHKRRHLAEARHVEAGKRLRIFVVWHESNIGTLRWLLHPGAKGGMLSANDDTFGKEPAMPTQIRENHAKRMLKNNQLVLCMGVNQLRSPNIAMIAAACGFDAVYIDLEHNPTSLETAAGVCVAALGMGITPDRPRHLARPA